MFKERLQAAVDNFVEEIAEDLCVELQEAEFDGYLLSPMEESLWEQLTVKLQKHWTTHEIPASISGADAQAIGMALAKPKAR